MDSTMLLEQPYQAQRRALWIAVYVATVADHALPNAEADVALKQFDDRFGPNTVNVPVLDVSTIGGPAA